ncbi:10339_t:CDS:2 [Entrophospora sp. SA101]|nr:10339_t:CDS:2 [Entrophospora sp. SA101]
MSAIANLKFSPEQISALLPDQRKQSKPDTVKNKVQKIMESTDPIGEASTIIFLESAYTTPENVIAIDSELKRIRHGLREKGASEKVIDALQDTDGITRESNRKQSENRKLRARIGISPSEHFSLESINARLQSYDTAKSPDIQALADVMVMLCMRPAEVTTL